MFLIDKLKLFPFSQETHSDNFSVLAQALNYALHRNKLSTNKNNNQVSYVKNLRGIANN